MANVFAITTVTDKLETKDGSAVTVFTVTNTTSRPLRGIAKIKPLGNTQQDWLKFDGETERDFPAGGTHQFTVTFSKPKPPTPSTAPQPAESFPFRFDAISTSNPDEDFTEGPIVTAEVPEQKAEEKKSFPWWIAAVATVLLLVVGGVIYLVIPKGGVEVPDFNGKTIAEAQTQLKQINSENETNLKIEKVEELAAEKEINKIFAQDPEAGAKADDEQIIKVTVPATATVKRVIGLTYKDAEKTLKDIGLNVSGHIRSSDAPKNQTNVDLISFQFPLSGTVVKGSEVQVFSPCKTDPCFKFVLSGTKYVQLANTAISRRATNSNQ